MSGAVGSAELGAQSKSPGETTGHQVASNCIKHLCCSCTRQQARPQSSAGQTLTRQPAKRKKCYHQKDLTAFSLLASLAAAAASVARSAVASAAACSASRLCRSRSSVGKWDESHSYVKDCCVGPVGCYSGRAATCAAPAALLRHLLRQEPIDHGEAGPRGVAFLITAVVVVEARCPHSTLSTHTANTLTFYLPLPLHQRLLQPAGRLHRCRSRVRRRRLRRLQGRHLCLQLGLQSCLTYKEGLGEWHAHTSAATFQAVLLPACTGLRACTAFCSSAAAAAMTTRR